ncbi:hypothetical protein JL720_7491 [Aureococcus anophagefferens]|nr:hypothetical protein JL720_7491 [Aureococcus anophagefferens]
MSANASGAEADCRGGLAAARLTVGGGWDCDSNKVSYAAFTFSTGFPLSWSGDAGSDEDWEEMEDWAVASLMPKLHKLKKDLEEVDGDDEPDFELLFNGIDPIQYYLNEDLRMLNLAMAIADHFDPADGLASFDLDMDAGTLDLEFSEAVDVGTLTFELLALSTDGYATGGSS